MAGPLHKQGVHDQETLLEAGHQVNHSLPGKKYILPPFKDNHKFSHIEQNWSVEQKKIMDHFDDFTGGEKKLICK